MGIGLSILAVAPPYSYCDYNGLARNLFDLTMYIPVSHSYNQSKLRKFFQM